VHTPVKVIIDFEGIDNMNRLEVLTITGQVVKRLNKDELKAAFVELNLDIPGNFFPVFRKRHPF